VISVLIFAYGKWVKGMDFVELFQAVVGIAVSHNFGCRYRMPRCGIAVGVRVRC
jgi:hypothetical protein